MSCPPSPGVSPAYRYLTAGIAPVGLSARLQPEDFRVRELPWVDPGQPPESGRGSGQDSIAESGGAASCPHLWFEIEKRGLTTTQAVGRIARALGVDREQVAFAGRKDAQGITRQFLSLEQADPVALRALRLEGLRILGSAWKRQKLHRGQLAGNQFQIVLRDVRPERYGDVQAVLVRIQRSGLPNYFGPQRFGMRGSSQLLGRHLGSGQWAAYLHRLVEDHPADLGNGRSTLQETIASRQKGTWRALASLAPQLPADLAALAYQMARRPLDLPSAVRALPRALRSLHLSAWQALVFNRVLAHRMDGQGEHAKPRLGDLLVDPWTGRGCPVHDAESLARFECAPDKLALVPSGPLPGSGARRVRGGVRDLEQAVQEATGLSDLVLDKLPRFMAPRGGRRPLVVPVRDLRWHAEGDCFNLEFTLPPGSYATVLIEEISKAGSGQVGLEMGAAGGAGLDPLV